MKNIFAAVRTEEDFTEALSSSVDIIFDLNPDLLKLCEKVEKAHSIGKKLFIHIDLASGIGKDKSGLVYVKNAGVDGIISTRVNIIKIARELGITTVQRFFVVDSHSVETTIEAIKSSKPDMIEVMPGIVTKVMEKLRNLLPVPVIAGGLIDSPEEAEKAFKAGAYAISTGSRNLW